MKASVVDLRYKMSDVLKALDRKEDVEILYRGKKKGTIVAHVEPSAGYVRDHPFFNLLQSEASVEQEMESLRGGRNRDL